MASMTYSLPFTLPPIVFPLLCSVWFVVLFHSDLVLPLQVLYSWLHLCIFTFFVFCRPFFFILKTLSLLFLSASHSDHFLSFISSYSFLPLLNCLPPLAWILVLSFKPTLLYFLFSSSVSPCLHFPDPIHHSPLSTPSLPLLHHFRDIYIQHHGQLLLRRKQRAAVPPVGQRQHCNAHMMLEEEELVYYS